MAVNIRRRTVATGNIRDQVPLDGALDGINREFTIPAGEKAIHSPSGGIRMKPHHNTRRLLDDEFVAIESGGSGTGYDTVVITAFAPSSRSRIFLDFIVQ